MCVCVCVCVCVCWGESECQEEIVLEKVTNYKNKLLCLNDFKQQKQKNPTATLQNILAGGEEFASVGRGQFIGCLRLLQISHLF